MYFRVSCCKIGALRKMGFLLKKFYLTQHRTCNLKWREPVAHAIMNKEQWEKLGQAGKKVGAAPIVFLPAISFTRESFFSLDDCTLFF